MSCCGSPRQFSAGPPAPVPLPAAEHGAPPSSHTVFEYLGRSALLIAGPVTGRPYHFAAPGARLAVQRDDAASLLRVPVLRPVRG